MKILNRIAAVAALIVTVATSNAAYQITFNTLNDLGNPTNPVFDTDGTTRLSGANGWVGQIYVSVGSNPFVAVKDSSDATAGSKQFATGGAAGWIVAGGDLTVADPSVTANPTAARYQLRVWNTANGSSYEAASAVVGAKVGVSSTVNVNLLGYTTGAPPIGYPQANGFGSFALTVVPVPEPATIALGLFGAAGLLMRRRK